MNTQVADRSDSLKIRQTLKHRIIDELNLMGSIMHRLQLAHRKEFLGRSVDGKPVCAWLGFEVSLRFWGFGDDEDVEMWNAEHQTTYVDTLFSPVGVHWVSVSDRFAEQNWKMTGSHWPCFHDNWDYEPREVLWEKADSLLPKDYWDRATRPDAIQMTTRPTRMPAELVLVDIDHVLDASGRHSDIVKGLTPYAPR